MYRRLRDSNLKMSDAEENIYFPQERSGDVGACQRDTQTLDACSAVRVQISARLWEKKDVRFYMA